MKVRRTPDFCNVRHWVDLEMSERSGKKKLKALRRAHTEATRVYREHAEGPAGSALAARSTEPVVVEHFLQAYGELTDATVELYRWLDPQDPRHRQVREALARAGRAAAAALAQGDEIGAERGTAGVLGANGGVEAGLDLDSRADLGVNVEPESDAELNAASLLAASGSVELVRVAPESATAAERSTAAGRTPAAERTPPAERSNSADTGAALDRRAMPATPANLPAVVPRHWPRRWLPDESFLVRYTRVRRATHRWPDEAVLSRYLRTRQLPDESGLRRFVRRRRELYRLYGQREHS
jgi:hypothetical protein